LTLQEALGDRNEEVVPDVLEDALGDLRPPSETLDVGI